jgi:hypothetical protein
MMMMMIMKIIMMILKIMMRMIIILKIVIILYSDFSLKFCCLNLIREELLSAKK